MKKILHYKEIILYAISMAAFMLILEFVKYKFMLVLHSFEIYATLIALLFTALGIWVAQKITRPKVETIIIEKEIERLRLSKRELEVLELMSKGLSNQEIANKLFVSLATIKSHSSNIFEKLDVKRRTQAVEKAKKIQLIA